MFRIISFTANPVGRRDAERPTIYGRLMRGRWEGRNPDFEPLVRSLGWGRLVRFAREAAGTGQFWLAYEMDCSQSVIARMEAPGNLPTVRTLTKIAAETGCTLTITMRAPDGRSQDVTFDGIEFARRRMLRRRARASIAYGRRVLEQLGEIEKI